MTRYLWIQRIFKLCNVFSILSRIDIFFKILQLALLPRSWNPAHSQSFPCHHLYVQATQQFLKLHLWSDSFSNVLLMSRHQKFGHHSQSEFSQRRHKSRPQENKQASVLIIHLTIYILELTGFLHRRVSTLCQKECSPLERNHWRLGLYNARSQLEQYLVPGGFSLQIDGGFSLQLTGDFSLPLDGGWQLCCVEISAGCNHLHSHVPQS